MSWVRSLARPDIVALEAYEHVACAPGITRLHANELPWRTFGDDSRGGLNRYPEPQPPLLIERLAELYRATPETLLVTRGSDEAIDLLIRCFCRAEHDAVLICPPTFGLYALATRIQGARLISAPLSADSFALETQAVLDKCTPEVKLVFLCSPNNPTGNLLDEKAMLHIARALGRRALVVVDEAYLEFSERESLARHLASHPNLAMLRTLSKAHALAGARCGTLIAHPEVVELLKKVMLPYAIAQLTLESVVRLLDSGAAEATQQRIKVICGERERVREALAHSKSVRRVWPSHANFVLAEFHDANQALLRARDAQFLVRDARGYPGLSETLRITIGTPAQNERLIRALS